MQAVSATCAGFPAARRRVVEGRARHRGWLRSRAGSSLERALADVRRMDGSGDLILATEHGCLAMGWCDGHTTVTDVLDGAGA